MELWSGVLGRWYRAWFAPEEDAETNSRCLVEKLSLSGSTARFVTAIRSENGRGVLYVLATQPLSEMSALDAVELIRAANPSLVIAHVNQDSRPYLYSECAKVSSPVPSSSSSSSPLPPAPPSVPDSALQVVRRVVSGRDSVEDYEKWAGVQLLRVVFGTSSFGHIPAAFQEAKKANSSFILMSYRRESDALAEAEAGTKTEEGTETEEGVGTSRKEIQRHPNAESKRFSSVFQLVSSFIATPSLLTSSLSAGRPPVASPSSLHPERLFLKRSLSDLKSPSMSSLQDVVLSPWPAFAHKHALPFIQAYALGLSDLNEELHVAKRIALQVSAGERVREDDIRMMWKFREATERIRIQAVQQASQQARQLRNLDRGRGSRGRRRMEESPDLDSMDEREKEMTLISHAISQHLEKNPVVVALVNASDLPHLQRGFKAKANDQVVKASVQLVVQSSDMDLEGDSSSPSLLPNAISSSTEQLSHHGFSSSSSSSSSMIGAGVAATITATITTLLASKLGYLSGILKFAGIKIPSATKVAVLLWKRSFAVSTLKSSLFPNLILSSKTVTGVKTTATATAAVATKGSGSGGLLASAVVDAAQKYSLGMARTAFYRVMQQKHTRVGAETGAHHRRPSSRPWVFLSMALVPGASLLLFSSEFERAITVAPEVRRVAKLGQGLKRLEESMGRVGKEDFWFKRYQSLYDTSFKHAS